MKKTLYRTFAMLLVVALCVALVACNKNKEEEIPDEIDTPVRAEGIALNWQEALMVKGSTLTLTHTVSPDGAEGTATYTSSNTEVAQVTDQGVVSAVKAGVATVTAKIDDSHYAECRIVVGDVVVTPAEASQNTQQPAVEDDTTPDTPNAQGDTQGDQTVDQGAGQGNTSPDDTQTGDGQGDTPMGGDTDDGDTTQGDNTDNLTGGTDTPSDTTGNATGDTMGNTTGSTTGDTEGNTADEQEAAQPELRRTVVGGTQGTTRFNSVQEAVTGATAGSTIVVDSGNYAEDVTIGKNLTIVGVNNPKLQAVTVSTGSTAKLQNLSLVLSDYPSAGEAALHVASTAGVEVKDCVIRTTATGEPEGGYGILVEKQSRGIRIENNSIGNFRYGIYVCPTDQSVVIQNNRLTNLSVGIGLDVRQENAETNYPTTGTIADNEYNEVENRTQFLHYGENYEGDFDFGDNEEENASEGNSNTGGSGLLE